MHRTHGRRPWCLAVIVALALVVVPAVPAPADHAPAPGPVSGTGDLEGTESVQDERWLGAPCFEVTRSVFALRGAGTVHGRTPSGQQVVYRAQVNEGEALHQHGPLQLEVENTEVYYHGPWGTHGTTDNTCALATSGTFVPAEFRIFAAGHVYRLDDAGEQVPCRGQGSFARGNMDDDVNWRAQWNLDEDCVVVGNEAGTPGTGVAPAGTAHLHHGSHDACFSPPCLDNFKVDYAQYVPVAGPFLALSGPASAPTGEAVTLTARVTDDGDAVANVPVTFSVTGPGPAAPPGASAVTGLDGRATFTFTAAVVGDYTVAASATHAGQVLSATHQVAITPPEPLRVSLSGPPRGQADEPTVLVATVHDNGDPAPGVRVSFTVSVAWVAGEGQASPASGIGVTDASGQAAFTFTGDRAGDYTVTARATQVDEEASATHTVDVDSRNFYRVGGHDFPAGEDRHNVAVIDPAGRYAYFGASGFPALIVKVDLSSFERVGAVSVNSGSFNAAVMDPAGRYAYFAGKAPGISAARVVKVDLDTFKQVGALDLESGEQDLGSAVIDPSGQYAYFATAPYPYQSGRVVKVDLNTFQRVGAITLAPDETAVFSAVMDPAGRFAYFGAKGEGQTGGRVVKVDLATFARVGAVTLDGKDENHLRSAVIDPSGEYAYFGTESGDAGRVVKVDLDPLQRVGAITLVASYENNLTSAVIDPAGDYAYFGTNTSLGSFGTNVPERVVKVDLRTFERALAIDLGEDENSLWSAVIAPGGDYAYFGTGDTGSTLNPDPTNVVKVALQRPPKAELVAGDDAYATGYLTALTVPAPGVLGNDADTEDDDPLVAVRASDPPGGEVALDAAGSFTYTPDPGFSGTDTFTYAATDGRDYSPPATVSVRVDPPPEDVSAVSGGAFGYSTMVSLFGGPAEPRGPAPSVTLPAAGGNETATDPDGDAAVYGPANIFENHGALTVRTEGSTGPGGNVASSATVVDIRDNDPFRAGEASSSCSAAEAGLSGQTQILDGTLVTSTHPSEGTPTSQLTFEPVYRPAPNTTYEGSLDHVGDRYRIVFNEQIFSPDAILVNAVHLYLLGPTAVGDMIIGQSRCGVVADDPNAAPVAGDDAYTATSGRPLTVSGPGVLANDTDPDAHPLSVTTLSPIPPPASGGGAWTFPSDPANGTLSLGHDGSFTYTPDPGFVGADTFTYVAPASRGTADTAAVTVTVEAPVGRAPMADFDGDGDTDVSVFRPSSGAWFIQEQATTYHGRDGDAAVPADYDGDGDADIAVFRPSSGGWFVQGRPTVYHGRSGDIPVPGDYDGDGDGDIAVFRPASGGWYVAGQAPVFFGRSGDIPVPGDYDGDGDADIAVFRPASGAWFIQGQATVYHGRNGDVPVPGDYDGDGDADIAVFRPQSGGWYVQAQPTVFLGRHGDVPVAGHYAGGAGAEIGVFRPANGGWYRPGQPTVYFGRSGDAPLPLPYAIRQAIG